MENATNALRIAAGILIAMLVVSLLIYGVIQLRNYQNSLDETKRNEQIQKFNQSFESYNKKVISGYQMISLANLTRDANEKYKDDESFAEIKIYIKLQNTNGTLPGANTKNVNKVTVDKDKNYYDLIDYITNVYDEINKEDTTAKNFKSLYFQCTYVGYDDHSTPRVKEMRFTEIKKVN